MCMPRSWGTVFLNFFFGNIQLEGEILWIKNTQNELKKEGEDIKMKCCICLLSSGLTKLLEVLFHNVYLFLYYFLLKDYL